MTPQEIFKQNGYCKVESVISDEIKDFVTQCALFDEMRNFMPEKYLDPIHSQVPNAHTSYGAPFMETLLVNLHSKIEEITDLKLHPTYCYYRVYREGDKLDYHTDRPECEISTTICFNHSYESNYSWPIYMEENAIYLNPGDMAVYRGCEIPHWRKSLEPPKHDDWHVQGFFHYVNADGQFANQKWDSRPSLGLRKKTKSYISFTKDMNAIM